MPCHPQVRSEEKAASCHRRVRKKRKKAENTENCHRAIDANGESVERSDTTATARIAVDAGAAAAVDIEGEATMILTIIIQTTLFRREKPAIDTIVVRMNGGGTAKRAASPPKRDPGDTNHHRHTKRRKGRGGMTPRKPNNRPVLE